MNNSTKEASPHFKAKIPGVFYLLSILQTSL
jgi:hypothetical protein